MTEPLDTSYFDQRLAEKMEDPEFRVEFERASRKLAQVDAVMQMLDELRVKTGLSKAELARRIGKDPSSVRRLFTAEVNPELGTIAAMADELGAEIKIVARRRRRQQVPAAA